METWAKNSTCKAIKKRFKALNLIGYVIDEELHRLGYWKLRKTNTRQACFATLLAALSFQYEKRLNFLQAIDYLNTCTALLNRRAVRANNNAE